MSGWVVLLIVMLIIIAVVGLVVGVYYLVKWIKSKKLSGAGFGTV